MVANSHLQKCTLVLGGAASGKSFFAEQMVKASGRPKVYVATSQVFDDEMRAKVEAHRTQRGENWRTVEEPLDLQFALSDVDEHEVVLVDCATLWLTNHLLAETDLDTAQSEFLLALATCPAPIVVVSNEVGMGIVPDNALSRRFRNAQGQLNQAIAAQADTVVFVAAGLPMVLKGAL